MPMKKNAPIYMKALLVTESLRSKTPPSFVLFCYFFLVAGQFAEADIAKSLLHMISNDIGQVLDITSQANLSVFFFIFMSIRVITLTKHNRRRQSNESIRT